MELTNLCLFCLTETTSRKKNLEELEEEAIVRLLFVSKNNDGGLTSTSGSFRRFFWRMLVGEESTESGGAPRIGVKTVEGSTEQRPKVCYRCLQTLRQIQRLHSNLETVQMLLLEEIGRVQRSVMEANELLSDDDSSHWEELKKFQEEVIRHSSEVCRIPTVFLGSVKNRIKMVTSPHPNANRIETRKFSKKRTTTQPSPRKVSPAGSSVLSEGTFSGSRRHRLLRPVKEELPELPTWTDETEPNEDSFSEPEFVDNDNDEDWSVLEVEIEAPAKRRGRPRKNAPTAALKRSRRPAAPKTKLKEPDESDENLSEEETTNKKHHRLYRCDTCGRVFFKVHSYLKHKQSHKDNSEELDNNSEKVACPECEESVHTSDYYEHLHLHERSTTSDENLNFPFQCRHKDCPRKFRIEENLKIHMDVDHTEIMGRTFLILRKCDVCNICYDTSEDLLDHMRKVHKSDPQFRKLLQCPVPNCGFASTQNETMIVHSHNHNFLEKQACFLCPFTTSGRSELLSHLRTNHQLETGAGCPVDGCQEEFDDLYFYKVHLRTEHKRKEVFICNFCGKASFFPSTFLAHFRRHKKLDRRGFQCPDCPEKFRKEDLLHRHRVLSHNAPKLSCEVCGKQYMTPYVLKTHQREHRKEGYHCTVCDRYFGSKSQFSNHIASHSDARPYVCEVCGAAFKIPSKLSEHKRRHDKKFECEICGRKFAFKISKMNHMKMHTGETLVCQFCGYEFHNKKSLRVHVAAYHTSQNPLPLYPPQKRRKACSRWRDEEGNVVLAKPGGEGSAEGMEAEAAQLSQQEVMGDL